jgi:hypothetical protein
MKTVFEASNAVEAHMVLHLLQQQGLQGRVDGEYLQGGIGELPAVGLVRVVVDDADYEAARAVVTAFETTQPTVPTMPPAPRAPSRTAWAGVGLVAGILLTWAAMRAPVSQEGVDHDRDGTLDEHWFYSSGGAPLRVEADRNFDHRTDHIGHYERGSLASAESDDDFDGRFESRLFYRAGSVQRRETDGDGDGFNEWASSYRHGVLESSSTFEPSTGLPLRVEHFKLGRLIKAEQDTDRDGRLDTRLRYDALGEVVARDTL